MILFFIIILYLLLVGFMTILERKVIGLVQSRISVFRSSFLGFYQFYLDFFKLLVKGFFDFFFVKILYYNFFILIFFINNIFIFILVLFFCCFDFITLYDLYFFVLIEGNSLLFKVYIFSLTSYKFIIYNEFRLKKVYIFLEFISLYFFLLLIVLKFCKESFFLGLSSNYFYFNFSFVILFLLFIIMIFKMFRTPFDYLESESELVNGISLEFYGYSFLLWSLVEYSSIFNMLFLLSFILNSFLFNNFLFIISFNLLIIFLVFLFRSIFVRFKVESSIYFLVTIYCIFNLLLFVFFVL